MVAVIFALLVLFELFSKYLIPLYSFSQKILNVMASHTLPLSCYGTTTAAGAAKVSFLVLGQARSENQLLFFWSKYVKMGTSELMS